MMNARGTAGWTAEGTPGQPGTYAFIVGLSDYQFLHGGPEAHGLDKLKVSALTACHFFRWAVEDYHFESAPLAQVRFLLAPTAEEQSLIEQSGALQRTLGTNQTLPPTLANMKLALQEWMADLQRLSEAAALKSRILFFFSGHGLELSANQQLLCPSDYLQVPGNFQDAISSANIYEALGTLRIPEQFFFIDACRSDLLALEHLSASTSGVQPLSVAAQQQDRSAPILHAVAPGQVAWQPGGAPTNDSVSYFGDALLSGLLARKSRYVPDTSFTPPVVRFSPLFDHVNGALNELLRNAGIAALDPAVVGGSMRNHTVTQIPGFQSEVIAATNGGGSALAGSRSAPAPAGEGADMEFASPEEELEISVRSGTVAHSIVAAHLGDAPNDTCFADLGLVRLTLLGAREFEWGAERWNVKSPDNFPVSRVVSDRQHTRLSVDFGTPAQAWYWIELPTDSHDYAFFFADVGNRRAMFQLEMALLPSGRIADAGLQLSECSDVPLSDAARLWNAYRLGVEIHQQSAETLLLGSEPLAASIAAIILSRTSDHEAVERISQQLQRLGNSSLSDPAVLALEFISQTRPDSLSDADVYRTFHALATFGTPVLAESCGFLIRVLSDVFDQTKGHSSELSPWLAKVREFIAAQFDARMWRAMGTLRSRLSSFRPGGMFASFVGNATSLADARNAIADIDVAL